MTTWHEGLKGQESAIRTLDGLLAQGQRGRFIMLHGPQGVGKATTARLLAAALLCRSGPRERCEACLACRNLAAHPDFVVLAPDEDGASIKIDDVRVAADSAFVAPMQGPRRVWIIDPMEALTTAAANALLRVLEEPPTALWVLGVTHNPAGVPITLRSRAFRTPFTTLDAATIAALTGSKDPDVLAAGSLTRARLLGDARFRKFAERWAALTDAPQYDPEGALRFSRDLRELDGGLSGFWAGVLALRGGVSGGIVRYNVGQAEAVASIRAEVEERLALIDGIDHLDANVNPALVCDDVLRRIRNARKQQRRAR